MSLGWRLCDEGFVYFAHLPVIDLVKIGWSADPASRLATLATKCRVDARLLGVLAGTRYTEREQQQLFSDAWQFGEWFLPTPDLLTYASGLPIVQPLVVAPYRGALKPPRKPEPNPHGRGRYWQPSRKPIVTRSSTTAKAEQESLPNAPVNVGAGPYA